MKNLVLIYILPLFLSPLAVLAASEQVGAAESGSTQLLSVSVDRIEVDTAGLAEASQTLAGAVDRLAQAIAALPGNSETFSEEEKQVLMEAARSAQTASSALADMAHRLPQSAQDLSERLPQTIDGLREPLSQVSSALQSAGDNVVLVAESLPQATENATLLVESVLDAALQRLTLYTILLVAIIALALIGIMWFIYRQYLQPLTRKLDELVGAPEHFENMARHMNETAASLQVLRDNERRGSLRSYRRYSRG